MTAKRIQIQCAKCGTPDCFLNQESGWSRCYEGHNVKISKGTGDPNYRVLATPPPPPSTPLTVEAKNWLRMRLHLDEEERVYLPAPVRVCQEGLLFGFFGSKYWQLRVHHPQDHRRWICPVGRFSTPYFCQASKAGTEYDVEGSFHTLNWAPKVLMICEGIMDALAIYNLGFNSLAVLTTQPRPEQLRNVSKLFDRVVWIPDGDVRLGALSKGMRTIGHYWPKNWQVLQLPSWQDPASLDRNHLLELIGSKVGV